MSLAFSSFSSHIVLSSLIILLARYILGSEEVGFAWFSYNLHSDSQTFRYLGYHLLLSGILSFMDSRRTL
jgi:hypothetical protein